MHFSVLYLKAFDRMLGKESANASPNKPSWEVEEGKVIIHVFRPLQHINRIKLYFEKLLFFKIKSFSFVISSWAMNQYQSISV